MSPGSPSHGEVREIDWLAPETRALLDMANQLARQRGAGAIYPEHLLLCLIEQHFSTVATLLQRSKLPLPILRTRIEATFPTQANNDQPGQLSLALEALECIKHAITMVIYHLKQNRAAAIVLPEHLLLSLFYHPRLEGLFASFSTNIFQLKNFMLKQATPDFVQHVERTFLSSDTPGAEEKLVHFAHLHQARQKYLLRSIEYPDLSFQQIIGLSRAKQALHPSINLLRHPEHYPETSHGLLLLSQHPDDNLLFIRAIAGEAGVPLWNVSCTTLVKMFLEEASPEQYPEAQQAEQAYRLVREVFYPLKMSSRTLIYFEDLETLALPEIDGRHEHFAGWRLLQAHFLTELDKLKSQPGTVVIAAVNHPQHLHTDFLRPGRLDSPVELYKPVRLCEEPQAQVPPQELASPSMSCPQCKRSVQRHWKHCVYCSASLARHCRHCGTRSPEITGARFCPECGKSLS